MSASNFEPMTTTARWEDCRALADVVCAQIGLDPANVHLVNGEFTFSVKVRDEDVEVMFPKQEEGEDAIDVITIMFVKDQVVDRPLLFARTKVPAGTGEALAAMFNGTYDKADSWDPDDTLYMKNVSPGPNVPPVHLCDLSLSGQIFTVPFRVMSMTMTLLSLL